MDTSRGAEPDRIAMRLAVRVLVRLLVLCGCLAPWHGFDAARAAAPTKLTMNMITMPGLSPLASVVNRSGTRAVLAVLDPRTGRATFLLYDLTSRRLLHRSVVPAALGGNEAFAGGVRHALDERRGRAYFFLSSTNLYMSSSSFSAVLCVIDLSSGQLLVAQPLGYRLDSPINPTIDDDTGAIWFVGSENNGEALIRIGPLGAKSGTRHFALPDLSNWSNLWLDQARRRAIVANSDGDFVGFDLGSGRKVFTFNSGNSSPTYIAGASRVYNPATGSLWIVDVSHPAVDVINVTDGMRTHLALGHGDDVTFEPEQLSPGDSVVFGLFFTPAQQVFALVLTNKTASLEQLSAAPLGHRVVATYPTSLVGSVIRQMAGPKGLQLLPIVGLPTPGTVSAYYLACQQGKDKVTEKLDITDTGTLSILDWKTGKVLAAIKVPVTGALFSPEGEPIDHGFFQTVATGPFDLKHEVWGGTALLVTTSG